MPGPILSIQKVSADEEQHVKHVKRIPAPVQTPIQVEPMVNYFANTMSKAGDDLPAVSNAENIAAAKPTTSSELIEVTLKTYSDQVDYYLSSEASEGRDFEKLLNTINKIIMLQMRKSVQADKEFIYEITIKKTEKSLQIKGTYNTWTGTTITVVSAAISIAGGLVPFSPLLPANVLGAIGLTKEAAASLAPHSTAFSNMGQAGTGVAQIFNSRNEGERTYMQTELQSIDTKRDDRSGAKQHHQEAIKTAKAAIAEFDRQHGDVSRTMTS